MGWGGMDTDSSLKDLRLKRDSNINEELQYAVFYVMFEKYSECSRSLEEIFSFKFKGQGRQNFLKK